MSTRNLEYFFRPRSVALIGASEKPASVGATVLANLACAGFNGPIWPVNPGYTSLCSLPCYPSIEALPGAPDLAVIATPAATVPALIDASGRRGTRAVVVISAGFVGSHDPQQPRPCRSKCCDSTAPNNSRDSGRRRGASR